MPRGPNIGNWRVYGHSQEDFALVISRLQGKGPTGNSRSWGPILWTAFMDKIAYWVVATMDDTHRYILEQRLGDLLPRVRIEFSGELTILVDEYERIEAGPSTRSSRKRRKD